MERKDFRKDRGYMIQEKDSSYQQSQPFTCGPSAYMQAYISNPSEKKELELHEEGRIKPTRMFLGTSFLKLNKNLNLYSEHNDITDEIVKMTYNPRVENFEEELKKYHEGIVEENKNRIKKINSYKDIKRILDESDKEGKSALMLSDSGSWLKSGSPHWIAYKGKSKEGDYLFSDPYTGNTLKFNDEDLSETISSVRKKGFPMQILTEMTSEKSKSKTLERIVSGVFVFSILTGLFLSSGNLTGNVVANSGAGNKFLGIILILVGIGGFFVYRKLK